MYTAFQCKPRKKEDLEKNASSTGEEYQVQETETVFLNF
jgi:hypothetical protein